MHRFKDIISIMALKGIYYQFVPRFIKNTISSNRRAFPSQIVFELLEQGKFCEIHDLWLAYFYKLKTNLPDSFIQKLFVGLKMRDLRYQDHEDITNEILLSLGSFDAESADYNTWHELSMAATSCGLIEVGGRLREMSKNAALELTQYTKSGGFIAACNAALENDNYILADSIIKGIKSSSFVEEKDVITQFISFMLTGDNFDFHDNHSLLFRSYVSGKTVAVVGPNLSEFDNTKEIESFDIIARIGYVGKNSVPDGGGERTNVSFYAGHKINQIVKGGNLTPLKSLDFIMLKKKRDLDILNDLGFSETALTGSYPLRNAFYLTSPNAVPEALYNFLVLGAKKVKVFNTTCFLRPEYPLGYLNNKERYVKSNTYVVPPHSMCFTFGMSHHPLAQFYFYKKMVHVCKLEGDDFFLKAMGMKSEEYLRELDVVYGLHQWSTYGL